MAAYAATHLPLPLAGVDKVHLRVIADSGSSRSHKK